VVGENGSGGEDAPRPLGSTERRELIRDEVVATGTVRIDELARRFGVTVMTIHRDLNVLEGEGWVRKVRGGAVADPSATIDTSVRYRMTAMVREKQEIARHALRHVHRGEALIVDDSTTAFRLAELLPRRTPLTVITNLVPAITALGGEPGIELIALGGVYSPVYEAFHGLHTRQAATRLRADVAFMSTTALMEGFLYHKSEETVLIRRTLMEAAARRVLLVDHSKLARRAVHQLASLSEFDLVIVDAAIGERDLAALRERGVAVEVAGGEGARDDAAQEPVAGVPLAPG
jgi:DeoR/GlpR family transcriptional regulator of sugar metabolism